MLVDVAHQGEDVEENAARQLMPEVITPPINGPAAAPMPPIADEDVRVADRRDALDGIHDAEDQEQDAGERDPACAAVLFFVAWYEAELGRGDAWTAI